MADASCLTRVLQKASFRLGRVFDLLVELTDCRFDFEELSSIDYSEVEGEGQHPS